MQDLLTELARNVGRLCTREGVQPSPVPGVNCTRFAHTDQPSKRRWRGSLAIVAQGSKEIVIGRDSYRCEACHFTVTPVDLPVISRIAAATPEKPFLAILIDLDPYLLSEVAQQIKAPAAATQLPQRAMYAGRSSELMLAAFVRLSGLFKTPDDAAFLGPLIIREILYRLLQGPDGAVIRQLVRTGSKMQAILQAIHHIKSELSEDLNVAELAQAASMSRSAFFKHFSEVTTQSPIQYQKRLRLHEARRLMQDDQESAGSSAFKVGYKSVSQFSREYTRMFGTSPSRDMANHR